MLTFCNTLQIVNESSTRVIKINIEFLTYLQNGNEVYVLDKHRDVYPFTDKSTMQFNQLQSTFAPLCLFWSALMTLTQSDRTTTPTTVAMMDTLKNPMFCADLRLSGELVRVRTYRLVTFLFTVRFFCIFLIFSSITVVVISVLLK